MRAVTPKQAAVLRVVTESIRSRGHAPTQAAIGLALGMNKTTVNEHIRALIKKGRLVRDSRCAVGLPADRSADVEQLERECRLLARLAAKTPQFDNPLHIYEAEKIRDRWLAVPAGEAVSS